MPKAAKEPKARPKTFEDVFVAKPEHDHCKQVLASKRIRDCCFTGWDTTREPYFPEDKGCYYMAANLELCPTTGREHWQGIACFNTVHATTLRPGDRGATFHNYSKSVVKTVSRPHPHDHLP